MQWNLFMEEMRRKDRKKRTNKIDKLANEEKN